MKPTVGRIVHYLSLFAHSPAIITRVWSDTCVNLVVFDDASPTTGVRFVTSSVQDQGSAPAVNTWHWPERE